MLKINLHWSYLFCAYYNMFCFWVILAFYWLFLLCWDQIFFPSIRRKCELYFTYKPKHVASVSPSFHFHHALINIHAKPYFISFSHFHQESCFLLPLTFLHFKKRFVFFIQSPWSHQIKSHLMTYCLHVDLICLLHHRTCDLTVVHDILCNPSPGEGKFLHISMFHPHYHFW